MPLTRNRIREIRSLAEKSARDELGLFVAEGLRLVGEAARSAFAIPEAFSTDEFAGTEDGARLLEMLGARGTVCRTVTPRELAQCADTVNPQGIIALVRTPNESAPRLIRSVPAPALLVALDGIADPGNLGSIIRTCDWFGAGGVLLGKGSVDPYNPKAVRATMGGIFRVPLATGLDLADAAADAKREGYTVYVAEAGADLDESDVEWADRSLIALGSEAHGVSDDLARAADARVAVRRYGAAESLNVGVACGILLAAHRRRHG